MIPKKQTRNIFYQYEEPTGYNFKTYDIWIQPDKSYNIQHVFWVEKCALFNIWRHYYTFTWSCSLEVHFYPDLRRYNPWRNFKYIQPDDENQIAKLYYYDKIGMHYYA